MSNNKSLSKRQKYKKNQIDRGIKRLEISIPQHLKDEFEAMALAVSEEFVEPNDRRQRLAKAKIQLIEELTQNINHDFFVLKDKISKLEAMVEFLSPNFEMSESHTPLPSFITKLSDDPALLKGIIANLYKEKTTLQVLATEYKRRSEQYLALYETVAK